MAKKRRTRLGLILLDQRLVRHAHGSAQLFCTGPSFGPSRKPEGANPVEYCQWGASQMKHRLEALDKLTLRDVEIVGEFSRLACTTAKNEKACRLGVQHVNEIVTTGLARRQERHKKPKGRKR